MRKIEWLRLPGVLLLAALVFVPSGMLSQMIGLQLPEEMAAKEWVSTLFFQLFMALIAILLMLLLGRGRLGRFGFRRGSFLPIWPVVRAVFLAELVVTLVFLAVPSAEGPGHFAEEYTFLQTVIGVWIVASTCEEIVTRGLIQGYLAPLAVAGLSLGRVKISIPVLTGAIVFSAMHVPLLVMGIETALGVQILISTFLLGCIAGYYRETTGSLIPAVLAHMLANVFGMGMGWAVERLL